MSEGFQDFIVNFKNRLQSLLRAEVNIDDLSVNRGLPDTVWNEIMKMKPLSVAIPTEYGGGGVIVKNCLQMISTASYESLSLALTFGINVGLFLQPFAKYANPEIKQKVFNKFLNEQAMGGLMITEPDFGSDALNMKTYFTEQENNYSIKGTKHWQGLTGRADFWIVAARNKNNDNLLARDLSFFVTLNDIPSQKIEVEHYFNNLGLYMIPYGQNKIDIEIPKNQKMESNGTGVKMMLDILHRSRLQFAAMGVGFIQRMLDEAIAYCTNRKVGGQSLTLKDSVRFQLSRIQSAYTLASSMCAYSTTMSGIQFDLSNEGIQANCMKALVSDLMQESAQICLQLSGSSGYKIEHIAGRGIVDSRPFQIFEGTNEMLYAQIAEMLIKQMKKENVNNFAAFLLNFKLTNRVADRFKKYLNYTLPENMVQRQVIVLGKIISLIVCLQYVDFMVERGFRKDLFDNTAKHVEMDIKKLISDLAEFNTAEPILENYTEGSSWSAFV